MIPPKSRHQLQRCRNSCDMIPMGCNIWAPHRSSCCWCLLGFRLVGSVPWFPIPRRRRTEFTSCSRAFWGALDWPVWHFSNTHRCCCWRCSLRICRGTQVFLPDVYAATGRTYRHTVTYMAVLAHFGALVRDQCSHPIIIVGICWEFKCAWPKSIFSHVFGVLISFTFTTSASWFSQLYFGSFNILTHCVTIFKPFKQTILNHWNPETKHVEKMSKHVENTLRSGTLEYSVSMIFCEESFPTAIRASATGVVIFWGTLWSVASPLLLTAVPRPWSLDGEFGVLCWGNHGRTKEELWNDYALAEFWENLMDILGYSG